MKRALLTTACSFLMLCLVCLGLPALAGASMVDLTLVPSKTVLAPGEDLDLALWMYPGSDSGGSIMIGTVECEVGWDSPNLGPRSGANPSMPLSADWFTDAKWDGAAHAYTFAGWNPLTPAGYSLGSSGLHLADIPLTAGSLSGPANLIVTFDTMYGPGSIWYVDQSGFLAELDQQSIGLGTARASVNGTNPVPLPASLLLFGSGLGGLLFRRGKRA